MKSSSSQWLLNHVFRDAAVLVWQNKQKCENPRDALQPIKDAVLEEISNKVIDKLMKELKISNISEDQLAKLKLEVNNALGIIDGIIIDKIETEYDALTQELVPQTPEAENALYKSIIDNSKHILPTKEAQLRLLIVSSGIFQIGAVRDKLVEKLSGKPERTEAERAIGKLHKDRLPDTQVKFTDRSEKGAGVSEGYKAKRDGETFMLKSTRKKPRWAGRADGTQIDERDLSFDSVNFFNEFLMSPLYERMLYKRTPIIAGVEASDFKQILLRSKSLNEFQTASEYTGGRSPNAFGTTRNLTDVAGAGKLMAALLAGGEFDIHAGNFGVMIEWDEKTGKTTKVFAKIDHGWSATQLFTNGDAMWENFDNACTNYNYKANINIDIAEFRESLDQILMITPTELEDYIKSRMYELKKMGFDPKGLGFMEWTDDLAHNYEASKPKMIKYDDLSKVEESYIKRFKDHWKALSQFRDMLIAVEKMTTVKGKEPCSGWAKGKWIKKLNGMNPVTYAAINGYKIDGKDPIAYGHENGLIRDNLLVYAAKNRLKIDGKDPIAYGHENGLIRENLLVYAAKNGLKIDDKDPIIYGHQNGQKIDGLDPREWAINNRVKINGKDPIVYTEQTGFKFKGMYALEYAINNKVAINGKDAIIYAHENGLKFKSREPIEYAVLNGLNINDRNPVDYAIEKKILIQGMNPVVYAIKKDHETIEDFARHYKQMTSRANPFKASPKVAFFNELKADKPEDELSTPYSITGQQFFEKLTKAIDNEVAKGRSADKKYLSELKSIAKDFNILGQFAAPAVAHER